MTTSSPDLPGSSIDFQDIRLVMHHTLFLFFWNWGWLRCRPAMKCLVTTTNTVPIELFQVSRESLMSEPASQPRKWSQSGKKVRDEY